MSPQALSAIQYRVFKMAMLGSNGQPRWPGLLLVLVGVVSGFRDFNESFI